MEKCFAFMEDMERHFLKTGGHCQVARQPAVEIPKSDCTWPMYLGVSCLRAKRSSLAAGDSSIFTKQT